MENQQVFAFLSEILKPNKYSKWYLNICQNALQRASTRNVAKSILKYVEGHHILPKSITANNVIVYLTIKEHYVCHHLLLKCLEGEHLIKMKQAFRIFSYNKYKMFLTARQSEIAKIQTQYVPCSNARRIAISKARLKTLRKHCDFCGGDFAPGNYTKYHGDKCINNPQNNEEMIKNGRSNLAKIRYDNMVKDGTFNHVKPKGPMNLICPHCNKQGSNYGAMMRMHFDRCPKLTGIPHKKLPVIKYSCLFCRRECFIHQLTLHVCKH